MCLCVYIYTPAHILVIMKVCNFMNCFSNTVCVNGLRQRSICVTCTILTGHTMTIELRLVKDRNTYTHIIVYSFKPAVTEGHTDRRKKTAQIYS